MEEEKVIGSSSRDSSLAAERAAKARAQHQDQKVAVGDVAGHIRKDCVRAKAVCMLYVLIGAGETSNKEMLKLDTQAD